jgi:hypothetical protein
MASAINSTADIPWPLGPESDPFCLELNMTWDEQDMLLRLMLAIYHPEMFLV